MEQDFRLSITVDASPEQVYNSINKVTQWWTENLEGSSDHTDDRFTVRFGDVHVSTQQLLESIPNQKVVWLVTDSRLNFTKDEHEWNDTKISFEIKPKGAETELVFIHHGLIPQKECYGACSNAWRGYLENSLRALITTGHGQPTPRDVDTNSNV